MRRRTRWLFLLLIVGVALAAGAAFALGPWRAPPAARYRQTKLDRGAISSVVNSTGTVQPVQSVQIGAFVSGPIESANVDFNSPVKTGDVLAMIDPRTYKANVARDEATLAHRKADQARVVALLEQAQNNERRALAVRAAKESFISETEIDQVVAERKSLAAQLETAAAAVKEAEAALQVSRTNLDYTVIKSPVDGVIIDRKIDPGQTVAAAFQTPVLFIVAPDMERRMYVYANVDEADIGMIREAQKQGRRVKFTVDAYPDDLFEGVIHQVRPSPTTTQNVVTYTVVVEAPNRDMKLLPGMTAALSFEVDHRKDVVRIPNAALRYYPKPEQVRPEDRPILEGEDLYRPREQTDETVAPPKRSASELATAARERHRRHVWVVDGPFLRAVEVGVGISDSSFTELVSGELSAGEEVVAGNVVTAAP